MRDQIFFNALAILLKDSVQKISPLIDKGHSFEDIWKNIDNLKNELKIKFDFDRSAVLIEKEYEFIRKANVDIILKTDPKYPPILKEIYRAPLGLYVKGDIDTFNQGTNIAIIGSRKASAYGKLACEKIINGFCGYNINVVSGLGIGIDSCAHVSALKNNLKTLAFIGSGFNFFYPSANKVLSEKIIECGGAIVSEYPINTKPEKYYFVARNRLISGISKAVLIVEAREKSGTMITAKFAEEQNRDILAIPNTIFDQNSQGTNRLIKDGATLIRSSDDVLQELGLDKKTDFSENLFCQKLSENQRKILALFDESNHLDVDFICEKTSLDISEIMAELTILELEGIIKQTENNCYTKTS